MNMEESINSENGSGDTSLNMSTTVGRSENDDIPDDSHLNLNNVMEVDSYKTIQTFFAETGRISKTLPLDKPKLETSNILSILRPYQHETVQWMIMRECKRETIRLNDWDITLPAGGILADEMGLGKTVEVLACILCHPRKTIKLQKASTDIVFQPNAGKRKSSTDFSEVPLLNKKPKLSSIKQNRTLKNEIKILLKEYFNQFKLEILKRKCCLSRKCKGVLEDCFKIILLNRFYNYVQRTYSKKQIWGYMISEFDVHIPDSIGYSILQKEHSKADTKINVTGALFDEEVTDIILCVNEFLNTEQIKRFEQDFNGKLRYSTNGLAGEFIPLLEKENVRCNCGLDKANGSKIKCSKCNKLQHLLCLGLTETMLKTNENCYCCPNCWMDEPPIQSSATLIVIPTTLEKQWEDEIKKHASDCNLSVYRYSGVRKNYLLPPLLAEYDIVLVPFSTLMSEFSFISPQTRSLRFTKRYHSFVTPLTCINWWRLCIDEAQMVENANNISEMAMRIKCEHIWAVTGTPIGNSLKDLYGLTKYLRIKPFTESNDYWQALLHGDQSLMHTLFAYIMRRMTKDEVYEQLQLPALKFETTWLSFPPTEGFFYNSTNDVSQKTFMQKINSIKNLDQPLKKADRKIVGSVLAPLLSLRQACVHPHAVSSINLFNLKENETMRELLEKMIKKTKVDCDDILRRYVMIVNGAAAIHVASQNYRDAVTLYRSVLAKTKIYVSLNADSFQMIHVMHNLYQIALKDDSIELTDEEKEFPRRIEELETKCLEKKQEMVKTMKQQLTRYSEEIISSLGKYELKYFSWWQYMLDRINFTVIVPKVLAELEISNLKVTLELELKLSNVHRLTESLKYWLMDIEQKRNLSLSFLDHITKETTPENLWIAAENCHIRKEDPKQSCLLCRMENIMLKYEALLFNIGSENEGCAAEGKSNPIDWKMSPSECMLIVLLNLARSYNLSNIENTNAANQLKVLNLLKREFRIIRAIWTRQCDFIHVYDEIRMAKCTSDLMAENAITNALNSLEEQKLEMYNKQSSSVYTNLQSKYGSLRYLKNLEKRYTNSENEEESCPVCLNSMNIKIAVMTCGHFICYGCMLALNKYYTSVHIQCPVCRSFAPHSSITILYGFGTSNYDVSEVKGSYSIKILAITAKVLHLRQEDPKVKILIFSSWEPVLDIIEKAFKENQISFQRLTNDYKRNVVLTSFKEKDDVNVLLMLLHTGSKGLNLTEASHIIFTEPVLKLADEKQAVGRICRLGQIKNMTVHKFIIKGTVEEHINRMNEELQTDFSTFKLTFKYLRDLFEASSDNNFVDL